MRNMLLDEANVKRIALDAFNMGLDAAAEIIASTPVSFVDSEALNKLSGEQQALITATINEVCQMLTKVIRGSKQPATATKGS